MTNLHERTAFQLNKILNGDEQLPDWLTYGRTVLCQKEEEKILPEEQKDCKRNSRGTKDQVLLDKAVLRDRKRRSTNLAIAWIDYRKTHVMIPHSWISECLEVFGVAENTENFLVNSMNKWKLELTSNGVSLGNVEIRRGIFQCDTLSPFLFVLCMVPLSEISL